MKVDALRSRFDWYEATLEGFDDIATHLAVVLGGQLRRERGRNGYAVCTAITRGDDELVRVYEGSARLGEMHVVITGESCDELVPLFRRLWPEHRVSRADSSVDLLAEFELMDAQAVAFAEARNLSFRLVTDSNGGATRYLGAPSSEVRVRVYKKSEQLRALHPDRASEVPDGVVRVELQARPGKRDVKAAVSQMGPDQLWGLSQWGQAFALDQLGVDAERTSTHFRRPSSWSRSVFYLAQQYGPLVRERAATVGRDEALAELVEVFGL
jgi:hypothetical protein